MAKKIGFEFGNREIKAAKKIEDTHAVPPKKIENDKLTTPCLPKKRVRKRRKNAKDWKVASVRIEMNDFKEIENYIEKNETSFNALIHDLLVEKGIIK